MDPVVYFEITASDTERAKEFYSKAFGWKMNDMPGMNYTVVHTTEVDKKYMPKQKGQINGGLMKKDKTASSPVLVISVKSVARAIKKIETASGKVIMPKIKVGDMGSYARVKDTEGNVIGVWEDIKK